MLASRSGLSNTSARALVDDIKTLDIGVTVAIRACDVGNRAELEDLIRGIQGIMPPIGGIIHGAMVLRVSALGSRLLDVLLTVVYRMFCSKSPLLRIGSA